MGGAAKAALALLFAFLTPVLSQIVFQVEPEDMLTATGSSALFDCSFSTSSPASLSWLHEGEVVTPGSRFSYLDNSSLLIDPAADGDEGEYTCRVTDTITEDVQERSASLTLAYILDSFLISPSATTENEGEPLQLFCIHSGSIPAADITWTLNNDVVVTSSRILVNSLVLSGTNPPQTSSSLYMTSTVPSDAGSYRCEARNQLLPDTAVVSDQGDVTVIGIPRPPSITQQPTDTVVAPGTTATFTCSASGQPSPTISWYHDGTQLSTEVVSISTSGGSSTLSVGGVGEEEEGDYHCQALNSQGSADSQTAELQLASLGTVFQLSPDDMVATTGTDARLDCLPPASNPTASVSWTKNFAQLPSERFRVLSNGSLLISSVALGDQAVYHCVATNQLLGVSATSEGAQLYVLLIPTVTPETVSVSIGQSTTFLCQASGTPAPSLTWYNATSTNQITAGTPRVTLSPSTLTLHDIVREDQGEYVCRATHPNGTTEASAMLFVNAPPLFVDPTVSLTATEGFSLTLPCHTLPDPTLTFAWFFNGIPILLPSNDENGPTLLSNGSLFYSSAMEALEGSYVCLASNNLGSAQGTVDLIVLIPPSLTPSPPTVTVTEGDTALLTCAVIGDPFPVLTWYRMGTLLAGESGTSLTLVGVVKEQEGVYECAASSLAGDDRASVMLVVNTHPTADASPATLELPIGSTASFTCTSSGDPAPLITWYNENGIDVLNLGDPRAQISGGTLAISSIIESDSQQYTCTASNVVGSNSTTVELDVLVPPTASLPSSITRSQGDALSLDCSPTGNPSPSVIWYKDSQLVPTNGRITISADRVLHISSLFSTDEGSYTCVVSNSQGSVSANTLLSVLVIPVIHAGVTLVTVNEGETAILDCNATGSPTPTVSWFHSSLPVPILGETRIQQADNDSLIVTSVSGEDGGVYVCQAQNIAGSETATLELVVNVGPDVAVLETFITVVQGSAATLTCTAAGQPTPSIVWLRNGEEVPTNSTPRLTLTTGVGMASLMISSVASEDEGMWVCVGSNIAGSNQQFITLSVLVPPTITPHPIDVTITEGTPHTFTCTATGEPLPLITWSRGGEVLSTQGSLSLEPSAQRSDAGTYTCTATNTAGSDSVDITVDVLYPPTITQAPLSQTAHLHSPVQFQCVADGNPDPLVTWNFQGNPIAGAQGNIFTIAMVAGDNVGEYTCVTTNSVGEDSATAALTVLFPPSPPTNLVAMVTSSTSITVQWAASTDDGGSPLVIYVVEYRLSEATEFSDITASIDTLSMVISGLTPYGQYEIRVRGENLVGRGEPSSSLLAQTHPDAPSAPGGFRVISSTSSSLSLTWVLPDPLNGQLAAYELQYGAEEDFENDQRTTLLFTTQYIVTGLQAGVTYLLRVRASTISLGGETLWGPYTLLRVRDGVELEMPTEPPSPSPSPSPSLSLPSSTSVQGVVSSVMSSEEVSVIPSDSSPASSSQEAPVPPSTASPSPPSPSPSPSQPPPSTSYSTSTSSTSSTSTSATPSPSPMPRPPPTVTPTELTLTATDVGTITVTWKPPESGVDSVDGYAVFLSPEPPPPSPNPTLTPHLSTLTTYNFTFTGLISYTEYTVTVAAYNEAGMGPLSLSEVITTLESAPSVPQSVIAVEIQDTLVLVSWLPPEMPNGIITHYSVLVTVNSTGDIVATPTLPVAPGSQLFSQRVTVTDLSLVSVRYRITVSAATQAGTGPESDPVFVGTQTLEPEVDSQSSRTEEYYVVRILPPLVGVAFIAVAVVILLVFCWQRRTLHTRKKGLYQFSEMADSEYELSTKANDGGVARDDLETSVYYVKDALDANVTYTAGPQVHSNPGAREQGEEEKEEEGSEKGETGTEGGGSRGRRGDIDMPDIGEDLSGYYPSGGDQLAEQGRDALEESPTHAPSERPDSVEFPSLPHTHTSSPMHPLTRSHMAETGGSMGSIGGSQDSLSRPNYHPGDHSYSELDAIRARKVQQRAKRFRQPNPESTGYSSGGLMETRIGAVGGAGGGAARESPLVSNGHVTPGELAHMY